jgi:hypothetical protein
MAKKDTLFTVAGVTTHRGADASGTTSERTKVRYGTDMIRLIKMLNNPKKIEDKTLGICLAAARVDLVELPSPMLKADALRYLALHESFQSAEDQALIAEEQSKREPKAPRARREKTVRVSKKSAPSLDSIKSRVRKSTVTVEDVLGAVAAPVASE